MAADILAGTDVYAGHYKIDDKQKFESYMASQLLSITLENKDEAFLRTKMLEMYANPLKNYLKAMEV